MAERAGHRRATARVATPHRPPSSRRRGPAALAALAIVLLALAGCGGSGGGASQSSSGGRTSIRVAYLDVTSTAPLVLGVKKGFFRQQGLDVTLRKTPAASLLPAVSSGQVDFAFTNPPAVLLGVSNGLPLKVVAPEAVAKPSKKAYIQLVVRNDSAIHSVADLNGKKVAVDTLFQLPHIALIKGARAAGADPSTFKFTEIPFPSMASALSGGRVDAAFMGEPFLSEALKSGDRSLIGMYQGWPAQTPFSMYVTTSHYADQNADVVNAFRRAIDKSNAYAQSHESEVRNIIPTYLKTPPAVANSMILPVFSPTLNKSGLQTWEQLMRGVGVLKKDVDTESVYAGR